MRPQAEAINALEPTYAALTDEQLKAKTAEFKAQLAGGAKAPPVSEEPQAFSNRRRTKARDE